MKSPFPGMDPFIEARGLWPDFHQRLMSVIADAISRSLPPRYVARLGHRTYIDRIDDEFGGTEETHFEPDVSVLQPATASRDANDGPLLEAVGAQAGAVIMHSAPSDGEVKEVYIDIYDLDSQRRLVTSVEVLSPANKRFHGTGWKQYERKRNLLLKGRANLVEIDLLRRGRRHPMQEPWPHSPFYVLVARKWETPVCHVWPAHMTAQLPTISIPLERGDVEIPVALQSCVDTVYELSRYGQDVKYNETIKPPLTTEESSLLTARLP